MIFLLDGRDMFISGKVNSLNSLQNKGYSLLKKIALYVHLVFHLHLYEKAVNSSISHISKSNQTN